MVWRIVVRFDKRDGFQMEKILKGIDEHGITNDELPYFDEAFLVANNTRECAMEGDKHAFKACMEQNLKDQTRNLEKELLDDFRKEVIFR